MTTALDIITGAAKLIGVLFKNEQLASDEANDGLTALNDMLSTWSNNSLTIVARVWEQFTISPADSYTIGTGQALSTARPIALKAAFVRLANIDYDLDILSDEQYEALASKSIGATVPMAISYDNGYPAGVIRLYPQVSSGTELHLLSEKEITSFAALTTIANLPPGWKKAIRYNLAVDLAAEYGVEVPPTVVKGATDSLNSISLAIAKNRPITFKPPTRRRFSIYEGY